MNLIPYKIVVGFWMVGILCLRDTETSANNQALMEFGFDGTWEYNKHYPGALGVSTESYNLMAYIKEYNNLFGPTPIHHILYDANPIDLGDVNNRFNLTVGRSILRNIYTEPYRLGHPGTLFIFPTTEVIKEVFHYEGDDIKTLWFCTDWKG